MHCIIQARVLCLLAPFATACTSFVEAPRLPADVAARIHAAPSPHFKAHLVFGPGDTGGSAAREETLNEVKHLLSASPWFDTLEADRAEASLLISVEPRERAPYTHTRLN